MLRQVRLFVKQVSILITLYELQTINHDLPENYSVGPA